MKIKFWGQYPNGDSDFVILEGDLYNDLREQALDIIEKNNWTDTWEEEVE